MDLFSEYLWQVVEGEEKGEKAKGNGRVRRRAAAANAPIPDILREAWIADWMSVDVSDGKSEAKSFEKDGYIFAFEFESGDRLKMAVHYEGKEWLAVELNKPSDIMTIFYGPDGKPILVDVSFIGGKHPVGVVGPRIRRNW